MIKEFMATAEIICKLRFIYNKIGFKYYFQKN